jgi:hypothetical protein
MDKVPSYSERTEAAMQRLTVVLEPQTVDER